MAPFTFLATLFLLLAISSAIIMRGIFLRRRFRRRLEEAIAAGVLLSPTDDGPGGSGRSPRRKLRRPVLYDVSVLPPFFSTSSPQDGRWEETMPVSASVTAEKPGLDPLPKSESTPSVNATRSGMHLLRALEHANLVLPRMRLRRARAPPARTEPPASDTPPSPPIPLEQRDPVLRAAEVQVAVIIAMPNPHRSAYVSPAVGVGAGVRLSDGGKGKARSTEGWEDAEEEGVPDVILGSAKNVTTISSSKSSPLSSSSKSSSSSSSSQSPSSSSSKISSSISTSSSSEPSKNSNRSTCFPSHSSSSIVTSSSWFISTVRNGFPRAVRASTSSRMRRPSTPVVVSDSRRGRSSSPASVRPLASGCGKSSSSQVSPRLSATSLSSCLYASRTTASFAGRLAILSEVRFERSERVSRGGPPATPGPLSSEAGPDEEEKEENWCGRERGEARRERGEGEAGEEREEDLGLEVREHEVGELRKDERGGGVEVDLHCALLGGYLGHARVRPLGGRARGTGEAERERAEVGRGAEDARKVVEARAHVARVVRELEVREAGDVHAPERDLREARREAVEEDERLLAQLGVLEGEVLVGVFVVVQLEDLEQRRGAGGAEGLQGAVHVRVEGDHDLERLPVRDVRGDDVHDPADDAQVRVVVLRVELSVFRHREVVLVLDGAVDGDRERRLFCPCEIRRGALVRRVADEADVRPEEGVLERDGAPPLADM
ncbi:hypothetical protein ACG7TL_006372 [Trametes sanguinea]